jgi:hypothetical protein
MRIHALVALRATGYSPKLVGIDRFDPTKSRVTRFTPLRNYLSEVIAV